MVKVSVTVLFDHFPAIISRLPGAAQEVVGELAQVVAEEARSNAPVRTGRLRDSISVGEEGTGYAVYSDVEYAPYVEYGHSGLPARPFLTPALEAHRNDLTALLADSLERRLGG